MKKDLKYISFLAGAIITFLLIEYLSPKPVNWTITLSHEDKNPFGSHLINERLEDLFPKDSIFNVNLTLYELEDTTLANVFVLAENFNPAEEDVQVLLDMVNNGGNVFIAAEYFSQVFTDTLNLKVSDYFFDGNTVQNISIDDTASLKMVNPTFGASEYLFRRGNVQNYFASFDTTRTEVLTLNDLDLPQLIKIRWGKGHLFISSTPLIFTNNYLLLEKNNEFLSAVLSYLPAKSIVWTEYYQLGRMEASTPLRFLLTNEALSWAYYLAIGSLLLFILFEAKRKQRIIPVIKPLSNTTLEFVGTIANLYYYKKDHKSIALKRINFFQEQLKTKYMLQVHEEDISIFERIAHKTGASEDQIRAVFEMIRKIKQSDQIIEQELNELSKTIDNIL